MIQVNDLLCHQLPWGGGVTVIDWIFSFSGLNLTVVPVGLVPNMLFSFFEKIVDPFPSAASDRSPQSIVQFCRHYTRGLERWLLIMAGLSTCIAIVEVAMFGLMGRVVDWLSTNTPDTLQVAGEGNLLGLVLLTVLAYPVLVVFQSLLVPDY